MTKLSRTIVVAVALLLLLVGGILALPGIVALNNVKNEIARTLSRATGRTVTIGGLHLTLYPWLGIRIDDATLGNARGFGPRPLLHVRDAVLEVRVLPLFSRRIVLRRVVLTGLAVNLQKNARGQSNWSTLIARHPGRTTSAAPVPPAPAFALWHAAGVSLSGATVHYQDAQTRSHYTLTALSFDAGAIVPGRPVAFTMRGVAALGHRPPLPFTVRGALIDRGTAVALNPLTVRVATVRARGRIQATAAPGGWRARGTLTVPSFAPRPLLAALGLTADPRDPRALARARGQLSFRYHGSRLRIYPLVLTVDQTTARGRVDADWHTHRYQADLVVNRLDVDSYLPAATVPATPSSAPVPATSAASAVSNTRLRGHLRLGTLIVHGLTLTAVDARMQVAGGRVLLAPVSADLYGGTAAATLTATITSPTPMMRATGRLRGVHVGALLRALRLFPVLSGRLAARTQLAGRGMTVMALERTLSGTVRLAIHQGTLTGLDLDAIGQEARQLTGAHRVQRQVGTAFHDLRASAVITNGVVHTQDLVIRTAHAVVQGTASVNLPAKDLNALLTVALPGELAVPVRVQGPFGHVRFRVALGQLFTQPGAAQRLGTAAKTLGNGLKRLLGLP